MDSSPGVDYDSDASLDLNEGEAVPLIDADRKIAAREWIRFAFERLDQTATLDANTIKAAIDAVDDWADANAASFNATLPVAFRNTATAAQKALLLAYVCMKRSGVL